MKNKLYYIATTLTAICLLTPLQALAAKHDPNTTVVTIKNLNTTEVYADLRKPDEPLGTNCLAEMKLYPGDIRIVKYGELQTKCQNNNNFLIDAYGNTHTIVHTALINTIPGTCLIEHHLFTIKVTCS